MHEKITCLYASPCGTVELKLRDGVLARAELREGTQPGRTDHRRFRPSPALGRVIGALDRYFDGGEAVLPPELMYLSGLTAFQRRVFEELMEVKRGELVTYGELAGRIGKPRAARAVGGAVGSNPLAIFIPCQRVVAAGGRPGGFGAGMRWKTELLALEGWTIKEDRLCRTKTRT